MSSIFWQQHHTWPQHAVGPPPKQNILRCNTAMHAFMHFLEYKKWGRWQDRLAWLALSAQVGDDEIRAQIAYETGKASGRFIRENKIGICDPKMHAYYCSLGGRPTGFKISKETHLRMKVAHSGENSSQWGMFWVTNGVDNKKLKRGTLVPKGYRLGRAVFRVNGKFGALGEGLKPAHC